MAANTCINETSTFFYLKLAFIPVWRSINESSSIVYVEQGMGGNAASPRLPQTYVGKYFTRDCGNGSYGIGICVLTREDAASGDWVQTTVVDDKSIIKKGELAPTATEGFVQD
jgi:hypothetical protein